MNTLNVFNESHPLLMASLSDLSNVSAQSETFSAAAAPPSALYITRGAALLAFVGALLVALVGVVGNLSTIVALLKYTCRSSGGWAGLCGVSIEPTTKFVIFLAATDLSFCVVVLPITAVRYLSQSWPFGAFLCQLYPLLYYGTVASSLMFITVITINRLVLITFNLHYRVLYNPLSVLLQAMFCYLFSFGLMSVPFFGLWGRFGYQASTFSCTILRDEQNRSPKKFLFTLGFLLPMSVIIVCYSLILFHVRRAAGPGGQRSTRTSKRDLRLTFLICVVFFGFLVCFLPLFVGNVFVPEHRWPYFHVLASVAAWLNACINPFIYFALNPRYRNAFQLLFRRPTARYEVTETGGGGGGGGGVGSAGGGGGGGGTTAETQTDKSGGGAELIVTSDLGGQSQQQHQSYQGDSIKSSIS